jgi:hypothetical protein
MLPKQKKLLINKSLKLRLLIKLPKSQMLPHWRRIRQRLNMRKLIKLKEMPKRLTPMLRINKKLLIRQTPTPIKNQLKQQKFTKK